MIQEFYNELRERRKMLEDNFYWTVKEKSAQLLSLLYYNWSELAVLIFKEI